jgi:hypothetical protein
VRGPAAAPPPREPLPPLHACSSAAGGRQVCKGKEDPCHLLIFGSHIPSPGPGLLALPRASKPRRARGPRATPVTFKARAPWLQPPDPASLSLPTHGGARHLTPSVGPPAGRCAFPPRGDGGRRLWTRRALGSFPQCTAPGAGPAEKGGARRSQPRQPDHARPKARPTGALGSPPREAQAQRGETPGLPSCTPSRRGVVGADVP